MKFKCSVCNSEIIDISISKKYTLRDDYETDGKTFSRIDREYFDAKVDAIIYNCKCGEQVIRIPEVIDFVRDSDILDPRDLKLFKYGNLIITKGE